MAKKKKAVTGSMQTVTPVSKAPAISEIKLEGSTITIKWTRGEDYKGTKAGQQYQAWLGTTDGDKQKTAVNKLTASATSVTYQIDRTQLYPVAGERAPRAKVFWFMIRGKQTGKLYSDYVAKSMYIYPPAAPTLTHTGPDAQHMYSSTFTFTAADASAPEYTNLAYQTVLKQNCPDNITSLSEWNNATLTTVASGGTYGPSETGIQNVSATRCVRVKARGIGGESAWVYDKQVYAKPKAAENAKTNAVYDPTAGVVRYESSFNNPSDAANPVQYVINQYCLTVPGSQMSLPAGASFTDLDGVADTSGVDGIAGEIGIVPDLDEILFMRTKTVYEVFSTTGATQRVLVGALKPPTNLSVTPNQTNYKMTVNATNASSVPDSYLAIYCSLTTNPPTEPFMVGYIPHGDTSATVQLPNWTGKTPVGIGVKAVVGSTPTATSKGSYSVYSIANVGMQSAMQWTGGAVPVAPTDTSAAQVDDNGTILVKWNWPWEEADAAEISWADHEDAWESTDAPDTYEISNLHAAQWRISGLAAGVKWYIRVRLIRHNGEDATYGPYCNPMSVDLSAAPNVPVMRLSNSVIKPGGNVTVSWSYESNDGTMQNHAEICEVVNGTYKQIATTKTAQHITLTANTNNRNMSGWTANTQHTLTMRVWSDSNRYSGYAATKTLTIANPLSCAITTGTGFAGSELKSLPATITVTGAGTGGTTSVAIERTQSYDLETPDEQSHTGYEGETVYLQTYPGQGAIAVTKDALIGRLDDTAPYRIVATVSDSYGQTKTATKAFTVAWTNQAIMPEGTAVLDEDNGIAKITPTEPTGANTGDYVNIYRLSADKPQLIYEGAEFGTTYVDPYPTVGEYGGYRLAYFTANGDFITADYNPAVLDIPLPYNIANHIIDFGRAQVMLAYNLTASNEWEKSFQQTKYLGGAVQGDWLAGTLRSGSVAAVSYVPENEEVKAMLRRLAVYDGLCHVRTAESSNFTANVNVSEDMSYESAGELAEFSLDLQACDNPSLDGMTLEDWEEL